MSSHDVASVICQALPAGATVAAAWLLAVPLSGVAARVGTAGDQSTGVAGNQSVGVGGVQRKRSLSGGINSGKASGASGSLLPWFVRRGIIDLPLTESHHSVRRRPTLELANAAGPARYCPPRHPPHSEPLCIHTSTITMTTTTKMPTRTKPSVATTALRVSCVRMHPMT